MEITLKHAFKLLFVFSRDVKEVLYFPTYIEDNYNKNYKLKNPKRESKKTESLLWLQKVMMRSYYGLYYTKKKTAKI